MLLGLYTKLEAMLVHAQSVRNERGATAAEYGLLIALIAAAIILAVTQLGDKINGAFEYVRDKLPTL